jgi:hypothetical protein
MAKLYFEYRTLKLENETKVHYALDHTITVFHHAVEVNAKLPIYKGTGKPRSESSVWTFVYAGNPYYLTQAEAAGLPPENIGAKVIGWRTL